MTRSILAALLALLPLFSAAADGGTAARRQIILLIGDGMDEQQITIARNYLAGSRGELALDRMPLRSAVQVLTVEDAVDSRPVYVADSANTATSIASGAITSRGRIGTAPGSGESLTSIVELAQAAGYRTGLVTTASVTDATPAAFVTHINFRRCENPALMREVRKGNRLLGDCLRHLKANGGAGSISEQLAASGLDLILGGGSEHFLPAVEEGGRSVLDLARVEGFHVVGDAAALLEAPPDARLLGLFAAGTLPVRWRGEDGREAEAPERSIANRVQHYLGSVTLPEPMVCEPNPAFAGTPSLELMTGVALDRLSRDNPRGFFLMIESASIDKQSHERRPCGSIGELEQLDEALLRVMDFAAAHPDTLVLVTADHAHAAQLVPEQSMFAAYGVPVTTPGRLARLITPEGSIMGVNYATNDFVSEEHTGAAVPLFANDVGIGRIPPFLRQPEIFGVMRDFLGL